jgi:hypothetical protein
LKHVVPRTCSVVGLTTISGGDVPEVDMDCNVWDLRSFEKARGSRGRLMASERIGEERVYS